MVLSSMAKKSELITLAPVEAGEVGVDLEEAMAEADMMTEVVVIVTVVDMVTDTKTVVAAVDLEVVVEDLEAEAEVKKISTI